jgi:hypothetical protein
LEIKRISVTLLNISETHKFRESSQKPGSRFPQFYIRKISKTFPPSQGAGLKKKKNPKLAQKSVF